MFRTRIRLSLAQAMMPRLARRASGRAEYRAPALLARGIHSNLTCIEVSQNRAGGWRSARDVLLPLSEALIRLRQAAVIGDGPAEKRIHRAGPVATENGNCRDSGRPADLTG